MEVRHPALYRVLLAAMTDSDKSYLAYMAVRLLEMHRLLKPTGSIYLHCDPTMSHYLKLLLDAVFGRRFFVNEFIWYYSGGGASKRRWARKHDVILFFTALELMDVQCRCRSGAAQVGGWATTRRRLRTRRTGQAGG